MITYSTLKAIAKRKTEDEALDNDFQNYQEPFGLNESNSVGEEAGFKNDNNRNDNMKIYERKIKPLLDQVLSFGGLVLLSPLFGAIALAIRMDDPGPVFFIQKRIGKDKIFFHCHKFRTMKMSAPHDVPTHQLKDPDQYITNVGKVLRKTSLDELPQIWDIFRGQMSMIGPRPALWNQDDLVEARSCCVGQDGRRIDANSVVPGLTGLAQISGRDELEISDKARIDGEYVEILHKGGISALLMDVKCFFGTVKSVLHQEGVVEGGTGTFHTGSSEEEGYQVRK